MASFLDAQPSSTLSLAQRRRQRHASESATVMGASPWQTPQQLWRFKTGRSPAQLPPPGVSSCADLASAARAAYQARTGFRMHPIDVVEGEYAANMDGVLLEGQLIVEIKCPLAGRASALWHEAMLGRIPPHYQWQLQHQLMVSGAHLAHFYVFDGSDGVLIEHAPDAGRHASLQWRWDTFMHYVRTDRPPPAIDSADGPERPRTSPASLAPRARPSPTQAP